jgi:hypothetical protein
MSSILRSEISGTNLIEPLLPIGWSVDSISIGLGIFAGTKVDPYYAGSPKPVFDSTWLRKHVESVDIPLRFFDVESRHIQSSKMYYAGMNNVNAFSMSFMEDSDGSALEKMLAWQAMNMDSENNYSVPYRYKGVMFVSKYNLQVKEKTVYLLEYRGIWPSQIDPITLSPDSSDPIKIKVTFSIDNIIPSVPNRYRG